MARDDLNILEHYVRQQRPEGSSQYQRAQAIAKEYAAELTATQVKRVVHKYGPEAFDEASVEFETLWQGMSTEQRAEALLNGGLFNIYDTILSKEKVGA